VFSFIAAEKTSYPVAVMCRLFGVSRTGFHNWVRRAPSDRALDDACLTEKIKRIHAASQATYGAPRIHAELRIEHGIRVGRKRVARLMRAARIDRFTPRTLLRRPVESGQHVSLAFGRAAREAGIAVSMGSRGDAYDNAVAETSFATLKKELVNRRSWPTRPELQSAVFEYIEAFYNRRRRHSTLGMLSPVDYEQLQPAAGHADHPRA
jgi:putative transposase